MADSSQAFNDAINFALDSAGRDGLLFLRFWREGDWEAIKDEFPEFELNERLIAVEEEDSGLIETLLEALKKIAIGSEATGLWLDSGGCETTADDPGASWHEYEKDEQSSWLSAVAQIAREAIQKVESEPTGETS